MLYRKIEAPIREFLQGPRSKVLVVEGARQIGKSYIIRHVATELFTNYIELNLVEDKESEQQFKNVHSVEDFYLRLSLIAGDKMKGNRDDTIVFLDEIQEYPQLITLLKFLNADGRYTFVASGSLLGITLNSTTSIPVGSMRIMNMYPLDFVEFMRANSVGEMAIDIIRKKCENKESLDEAMHARLISLWKKYLLVGGLPDAVNTYLATNNIVEVREIQNDIAKLYAADASKYDKEHKLVITRVYDMIPSNMENKRKRVVLRDIEDRKNVRFSNYMEEFEYLISSGIALEVMAVSNPKYPLSESATKNLLKLYLNDPGLLSAILYGRDAQSVLDDKLSINLGSLYESGVAAQLKALNLDLFYYDNKKKGEVDFLVNDRQRQTILPIEVKSGKDYNVHSAIDNFMDTSDYGIKSAVVLSNHREVEDSGNILHLPIYYTPFLID